MKTHQCVVFLIVLLSFHYAAAGHNKDAEAGYYEENEDPSNYVWSSGCRCNKDLADNLDDALGNVRSNMGRHHRLIEEAIDEYEFKEGRAFGLNKFERKGPYRCSVTRNYVRIIFRIGFFRLLIHYKLSIVEDILSHFMGGFASIIAHFFGELTNFAFRIAIPEVFVNVVLKQHFDDTDGFTLEGFYISDFNKISFLNKEFRRHARSCAPHVKPVMQHAVRHLCRNKLEPVFVKHFREVRAHRDMFYYARREDSEEYTYSYEDSYEDSRSDE